MIMIMFPFQEFKEAIWSWSLSALEPKPDKMVVWYETFEW